MNTSLNRRGEPIVCSPQDSINMFIGCGMEYMVLGEYIVKKGHIVQCKTCELKFVNPRPTQRDISKNL